MEEALNVKNLDTIDITTRTDSVLLYNYNEYKDLLAKKTTLSRFSSLYPLRSSINVFSNISSLVADVETKLNNLNSTAANYAIKTESDSKFGKKKTIENKTPSFLTTEKKDAMLSKIVNIDDVKTAGAEARALANQLADEITDFVAAAMVGIRMSDGLSAATPTPTPPENGNG